MQKVKHYSRLESGSIIWKSYNQTDNENRSRTPGSVTRMQESANLPFLQQRRRELRLAFFSNVAKWLIPAIPPNNLIPIRNKRKIRAKAFDNFVTNNDVGTHQNLNNNCFRLPQTKI